MGMRYLQVVPCTKSREMQALVRSRVMPREEFERAVRRFCGERAEVKRLLLREGQIGANGCTFLAFAERGGMVTSFENRKALPPEEEQVAVTASHQPEEPVRQRHRIPRLAFGRS